MSIIENRPAIVLTRSTRIAFDPYNGAGRAPSLTAELVRKEIERALLLRKRYRRLSQSEFASQFIDHNSHKISEGRLTLPNDGQIIPSRSCRRLAAGHWVGRGQSIAWIDDACQDHKLTVVAILPIGSVSAMHPVHRAPFASNVWLDGATDLEHGQFAPFAGSGVERNSLIDRKPEKRSADRRQNGHAPACDVGIKRINQNDLLNLSGLFVPKFDLAAETDDVRTQFFRRKDMRAIEFLSKIFAYFHHWPARQRRERR